MDDDENVISKEQEMREHERQAREHAQAERGGGNDGPLDEEIGTPDSDAMPAPPGNIQGGNLGGAS